jgi:large subunit ribosomal protein L22
MGKPSRSRKLSDSQAKAFSKSIRVSPQKLNLVARSIRGKTATSALAQLEFSNRRISNDVKKILQSAIANAENNHQLEVDSLYVSEAFVGKSLTMKRWRPRARGRVGKILKPFSNLTIIVSERKEAA